MVVGGRLRLTQYRRYGFYRVIFALVQIGDEKVKGGRVLLGQLDRLSARLLKAAAQGLLKVFRLEQDVFVHLDICDIGGQ